MRDREKRICPKCGSEMYWTGMISQNLDTKGCGILYLFRCIKCRYESKSTG